VNRDEFNEIKTHPFFKGKVITDSMVPVIKVGEAIVIAVGDMDIKRFDIVVIYHDEKLICHYLWRKNKIITPVLLQTRNMAGGYDYPVGLENYLGKVLSHKLSFWQKLKILF
jgi:hypothetical protein